MLTTPTNDIPMPEDIKRQYDNAKNAVTLAEAEVIRLRDLRISEEVTIVELGKQKKYAEEQLNAVLANLAFNEAEVARLEHRIASLTSEIELGQAQKEELANSLIERENACKSQESHLADRELALALRIATLEERIVLVENREVEVKEKENNIKNFVATL